jgi:hypothetical protein
MDFLVVPTARFRMLYVWFIIEHGRRRILHVNVTAHPTSSWTIQQLREAFPDEHSLRFLIHDNDTIFSDRVVERRSVISESSPSEPPTEVRGGTESRSDGSEPFHASYSIM